MPPVQKLEKLFQLVMLVHLIEITGSFVISILSLDKCLKMCITKKDKKTID